MDLKNVVKYIDYHIPKKLKNKYVLTTLVLGSWVMFFSNGSLLDIIQTESKISELEKEAKKYKNEIEINKTELQEFQKTKERYAREKYYMKEDNEEVFVIQKK
jgi:cell division protein DivIC